MSWRRVAAELLGCGRFLRQTFLGSRHSLVPLSNGLLGRQAEIPACHVLQLAGRGVAGAPVLRELVSVVDQYETSWASAGGEARVIVSSALTV